MLGDYCAAEDCTQEAFERAYRGWKTWQPDAPAEAWLHRIALNVAFSYRRWQKLRRLSEVILRLGQPRTHAEAEALDLREDLWRALRRLGPQQAAIVVLRHHHGYTNREIAAALGVAESTVGSRLAVAKEQLRRELRGDVPESLPERVTADVPAYSCDESAVKA